MFEDDRSYFAYRAEVETERARTGTVPEAVEVHHQLAQTYLSKIAAPVPIAVDAS